MNQSARLVDAFEYLAAIHGPVIVPVMLCAPPGAEGEAS